MKEKKKNEENDMDEALSTSNHIAMVTETDSDSEDEAALAGYEPLPLDAQDDDNESSDHESDSGLESDSPTSCHENLPPISRIECVLAQEVWSAPLQSVVDIKMDSVKVNEVKEAMANVTLPLSAIPDWATNIPDDEWKQHLYKRLQGLQKSTV
ncbi:hypothetical protein FQA39_LY11536 [Lamprigera yunnana]|nr:hypothetical protein FQA39_LY11536 [Lamprigera yunnana]